jgi:hypothetical protein
MAGLKVGVLTFHRCINYGSYWQARALVEALQSRGHNANILDHQSAKVNIAEWKCAFKPVLPTEIPESDFPLYRQKIKNFFSAFKSLPLSTPFDLNKSSEMEDYDIVVVGSDEVWNLFHPWYSKCPLFYGEGIKAKRIISYAASFGNYPSMWGLDQTWGEKLQNFEMISVRDENSYYLVRNAIGVEPEVVLDPCLQFQINAEKRDLNQFGFPYVAVYGHNFSDHFIKQVKLYSKKNKIKLISIGYRNDWADDQWLTADPHDFANFIEGAEAVATNFFHGCVFSLRNHKPLVCETSDYRSNKVRGLLNQLGAEKHMVNEESSYQLFDLLLSEPVDSSIYKTIKSLRQSSNAFLDIALSGIKQVAA